jgi:hypothetical protein
MQGLLNWTLELRTIFISEQKKTNFTRNFKQAVYTFVFAPLETLSVISENV